MNRRQLLWLVAAPLLSGMIAYLLVSHRAFPRALAAFRPSPTLSVPQEIDIGEQKEGDSVAAIIPVTNDGKAPLELTQFRTNCGCSGVQRRVDGGLVPVSSLRVMPGETEELCLAYAAKGPLGSPIRHKVIFCSNDPGRPEVEVSVTMHIVGRLFTYPAIAALGSWPVGQKVSRVIDIRDSGVPIAAPLSRIECDVAGLEFRLLPPVREDAGAVDATLGKLASRCEITASLLKPGAFSGRARVYSKGQPDPVVTFGVSGEVLPPFALAPSALLFPKRSGGQLLYEGACHCRGPQGEPLSVDVSSAPKHLLVSVEALADDPSRKQITVKFDRSAKGELPSGLEVIRLRLRSNTQEEVVGLTIAWEARP